MSALWFGLALCVRAEEDRLAASTWGFHPQGKKHQHEARRSDVENMIVHWLGHRAKGLEKLAEDCYGGVDCASRDIYEFGVYTGRSMRAIATTLNASQTPFRRMWGFDSFAGLPEESENTTRSEVAQDMWHAGDYSVAEVFGMHSYRQVKTKVLDLVSDSRACLVRGFFNESLTPALADMMRPALFVDIDCDLYVSAFQALNWLFRFRLVEPGTVFYYDDMITGGPGGEIRAHNEIVRKYGVEVNVIVPCKVFQVARIDGPRDGAQDDKDEDPGSREEVAGCAWKAGEGAHHHRYHKKHRRTPTPEATPPAENNAPFLEESPQQQTAPTDQTRQGSSSQPSSRHEARGNSLILMGFGNTGPASTLVGAFFSSDSRLKGN
ncbi:hypothetical protein CTAYLR_006268 [Chrysophaeum taylorii]|uniref:Methyltransferase n=1 Tax=Chrysophaeum taylorii TaxID=2483200 RepID=A0AAD7UJW5_9STRA|nr:hypothetical protein CTAYLR_006268 [Chrysophaeum taylorii]